MVPRSSVPASPYDAYLRVYEPLEAFAADERQRWTSYAAEPRHRDRRRAVDAARWEAVRNMVATPPVMVPARESRDAFVLEVDGRVLLCPWSTRLRSWLALDELRSELPDPLLALVVPPAALAHVEAAHAGWHREGPDAYSRILTSTWHVPLWWFVPFNASQRELCLAEGERELVYRTSMGSARRRVARSLRILRETLPDSLITAALETLGQWLEEFHPRSWLELDYGGLVHMLTTDHLEADISVHDVAAGIAALGDGDPVRAGEHYNRLIERWRAVQALEQAS